MPGKIFLNYRRGDDPGFTQAIYQRLEDEFTHERVFLDVDGHIRPGDDFVEVLSRQVAASDIVLVVIGPRWVELMAERSSEGEDFVAIEIKAALEGGKRVIPVLVGDAKMPRADALPEGIRSLLRRNSVTLRPDRFRADCQSLMTALREQLQPADSGSRAEPDEPPKIRAVKSFDLPAGAAGQGASLKSPSAQRAAAVSSAVQEPRSASSARVRPDSDSGLRSSASMPQPTQPVRTDPVRRDDARPHPAVLRSPWMIPLAAGVLGAVCGGIGCGLFRFSVVPVLGQYVWYMQAIACGLAVGAAVAIWTDSKRSHAAIVAVVSGIGYFTADVLCLLLFPNPGAPLPTFVWGVCNWTIPILAVSALRGRLKSPLWVGAMVVAGFADFAFYKALPSETTGIWLVRGAVFFLLPMVCIGLLIAPQHQVSGSSPYRA